MVEMGIAPEAIIRIIFFVGIFILMAVCELLYAEKELSGSRARRWVGTLSLVVLNTLMIKCLFFGAAYGAAMTAERLNWGFSRWVDMTEGTAIVLSIILLDGVIYFQHVIFHKVPLLWRIHIVHHADMDCDVTTGIRFHPLEIGLSMLIKMTAVVIWGVPVLGVLIFEVMLNATSLFNHSNIRLSAKLDRCLSWVFVTPNMHHIHHSIEQAESDRNYGFSLSWWDRIFGTYMKESLEDSKVQSGVKGVECFSWQTLPRMLWMPFAIGSEDKSRAALGKGASRGRVDNDEGSVRKLEVLD
jgi:sterol desaturase/sphingolipid hydroxylase (fatty acid hydroxylase superfamily)